MTAVKNEITETRLHYRSPSALAAKLPSDITGWTFGTNEKTGSFLGEKVFGF